MLDEYDKCRFCKWYDNFDGCMAWACDNKSGYEPNKDRIVEKSKEKGISVVDLIALINME